MTGLIAGILLGGLALLEWARWRLDRRVRQTTTMRIEFHGGPKDGDREVIPHGMTRWTVTRLVPVLAPHWSRAEDDPTDLYRVQVVGWYERQGTVMTWRAA